MSKRIKRILAICMLLLACFSTCSFADCKTPVNSQEKSTKLKCLEVIAAIEEELEAMGTTVEDELLDFYTNLEKDQVWLNGQQSVQTMKSPLEKTEYIVSEIYKIKNTKEPVRTTALESYYIGLTGTIIAWFNVKGYILSAELLNHALNNTTINSFYYPTYGSRVGNSSTYWNLRNNATGQSGSGEFANFGSSAEKDLYYAIHSFTWYRHAGQFIVRDVYDFASDYSNWGSISGIAVNLMYEAQQYGVLKPYILLIYPW